MTTAAKTVRNCRRPPSAVVIGCSALFGGLERQCNPRDVVLTKPRIAEMIVKHFKPSGRVLDPCRGPGAFWKHMPGAEWCEIEEGRDFLEWTQPMDWIVSNPPYSNFWDFGKCRLSDTAAQNLEQPAIHGRHQGIRRHPRDADNRWRKGRRIHDGLPGWGCPFSTQLQGRDASVVSAER